MVVLGGLGSIHWKRRYQRYSTGLENVLRTIGGALLSGAIAPRQVRLSCYKVAIQSAVLRHAVCDGLRPGCLSDTCASSWFCTEWRGWSEMRVSALRFV